MDGRLRSGPGLLSSFKAVLHLQLFFGQTHVHPGPRKNVPTVVSTMSSTRNHVMIQNEIGRATSQRCQAFGDAPENLDDKSRSSVRSRAPTAVALCPSWPVPNRAKITALNAITALMTRLRCRGSAQMPRPSILMLK